MIPLGTSLPGFELNDTNTGNEFRSSSLFQRPVLVMFICNHCPYVVHYHTSLFPFANSLEALNISVVAISSNSISTHPEDGPEKMTALAHTHHFNFPYLYDETQHIAKAFQAECTPEFYLFNAEHKLVYRGRYDDSTPKNGKAVTGHDLKTAVNTLIVGEPLSLEQHPSIGCSIKWHP